LRVPGWLISAVIVDAERRAVLVDPPAADGSPVVRVPMAELPAGDPPETSAPVDAIEEVLGRPIVPMWMRDVEVADDEQSGLMVILASAEPERDRGAGRAFVAAEAVLDTLEPELVRPVLRRWLDRLDGQIDPRTPPWVSPAWYPRVAAWIAEQMARAGMPATDRSRIVYQSSIGTVLRTAAADEVTFTKCPAPLFHAEARITRALASRTPDLIPEVIDIEPAQGWLLMRDFGTRTLGEAPQAEWARGLGAVARIQSTWVDGHDELLAAGAQRRPLADLIDRLPEILEIDGLADRLSPALLVSWPGALPRLIDAGHELADIGLPDALLHGDLHPWNIAVGDGQLRVFDWSDAAIGPSFFDLALFLGRADNLDLRVVMRDAYLDVWADVAPRARLERASELAMALGAIYQVMTYQTLLPALPPEDSAEFAGADVDWLGRAILGLDHGLAATFRRRGQ
jgi:Phosphotransferase enzyme family